MQHRPDIQIKVLFANLCSIKEALEQGSIVTFEHSRIRIRSLPINFEKQIDT